MAHRFSKWSRGWPKSFRWTTWSAFETADPGPFRFKHRIFSRLIVARLSQETRPRHLTFELTSKLLVISLGKHTSMLLMHLPIWWKWRTPLAGMTLLWSVFGATGWNYHQWKIHSVNSSKRTSPQSVEKARIVFLVSKPTTFWLEWYPWAWILLSIT